MGKTDTNCQRGEWLAERYAEHSKQTLEEFVENGCNPNVEGNAAYG